MKRLTRLLAWFAACTGILTFFFEAMQSHSAYFMGLACWWYLVSQEDQ